MNKYLFILGFVGTALFTACSTADDLVSEKPIETPPVEEPKETTLLVEARQNSEIPITLGVGQSRGITRSPMSPDEEGNFTTEDGKYLGVFCLATGTQANESNIPTMIKNFKWNMLGIQFDSCIGQWSQIALNEHGEVMYCCHKPYQIIGHIMDDDILEKKRLAHTDMSMCDVPCRLTSTNHILSQVYGEQANKEFI
jgi:hypothetical protein